MQQYHPGDSPVPGYLMVEALGRGRLGEVWKARGPGRKSTHVIPGHPASCRDVLATRT